MVPERYDMHQVIKLVWDHRRDSGTLLLRLALIVSIITQLQPMKEETEICTSDPK